MAKNINPHYNANLHFPGVKYDVFMSSSIHVAILGKILQENTVVLLLNMYYYTSLRLLQQQMMLKAFEVDT